MDTKIYSQDGKESGSIALPESVFGVAWNDDLMHEVVVAMRGNARQGTAHTKDRGEVRGGGKKPWRQKGTGRARHGSRRSPLWSGGGTTFGPRTEKDYSRKVNKNARSKALAITLSKKLADGEMIFVDALSFEAPKTAAATTSSIGEIMESTVQKSCWGITVRAVLGFGAVLTIAHLFGGI